jgi:hypothetical protein
LNRSLRKALLLWLLLPAGLALVTFLPLAFHLVHQPAMEALDRALADASLALVPHLEVTDGEALRVSCRRRAGAAGRPGG